MEEQRQAWYNIVDQAAEQGNLDCLLLASYIFYDIVQTYIEKHINMYERLGVKKKKQVQKKSKAKSEVNQSEKQITSLSSNKKLRKNGKQVCSDQSLDEDKFNTSSKKRFAKSNKKKSKDTRDDDTDKDDENKNISYNEDDDDGEKEEEDEEEDIDSDSFFSMNNNFKDFTYNPKGKLRMINEAEQQQQQQKPLIVKNKKCAICKKNNNLTLIQCKICKQASHLRCLGIDQGSPNWICDNCKNKISTQRITRQQASQYHLQV